MGDGRTYDQACALRAVTSTDGMTADFYPFDMKFLGATATRIINEVKGVNRQREAKTAVIRTGRKLDLWGRHQTACLRNDRHSIRTSAFTRCG
jgi:hypothetical protein